MSRTDRTNMCCTSADATRKPLSGASGKPLSGASGKRREQLADLSIEFLGGHE